MSPSEARYAIRVGKSRTVYHKLVRGTLNTVCSELALGDCWQLSDRLPKRSEYHCRHCWPNRRNDDISNKALPKPAAFDLDDFLRKL